MFIEKIEREQFFVNESKKYALEKQAHPKNLYRHYYYARSADAPRNDGAWWD